MHLHIVLAATEPVHEHFLAVLTTVI